MTSDKKGKVKLHDASGNGAKPGARDADFSQLDEQHDGGAASEGGHDAALAEEAPVQTGSVRTEEIDPSAEHIQRLEAEVAELKDKYLRALAELENVKKRELRERSELLKYQGDRLVADLLPVLDNLELALSHKDADPQQLKTGVEMIQKLFIDALGKWGIRAVSAVGEQFDPSRFAAISKMPSAGAAAGTVIAEARKAYFYKDKLLRPGEVVVSTGAEGAAEGGGEDDQKEV
jgi:molecular chaperone GrpE